MEIKIGIQQITRELTVETDASAKAIESSLREAFNDNGLMVFTDDKGRRLLVPAAKIAYLDLGQEKTRPVGFGSI